MTDEPFGYSYPKYMKGLDVSEFQVQLANMYKRNYHDELTMFNVPELSAQMFEDAVEHINTHGWSQGADVKGDGTVCAQGAFGLWQITRDAFGMTAVHHDIKRHQAFYYRQDEVMMLMGIDPRFGGVVGWNDHSGRTKEQVIDALTKAAKTLREQGR